MSVKRMTDAQLQVEHQKRRRQVISSGFSITGALIAALPSHFISLIGLTYSIPRLFYVGYKKVRAAKELARRGVSKLKYTVGDVLIPLAVGAATAALGGLADGAHVVAQYAPSLVHGAIQGATETAATHATDAVISQHVSAVQHVTDAIHGGGEAVQDHLNAIIDPHSASDAASQLWHDGYHDVSDQLRQAVEQVRNAVHHPEILMSQQFLNDLGSGFAATFIAEKAAGPVEVTCEKVGGFLKYHVRLLLKGGSTAAGSVVVPLFDASYGCNVCGKNILGERYHCLQCTKATSGSFDICVSCAAAKDSAHQKHTISLFHSDHRPYGRHGVGCDDCGDVLKKGYVWHCTESSLNLDFCQSCYPTRTQGRLYPFLLVYFEEDNFHCSACAARITAERYECTKGGDPVRKNLCRICVPKCYSLGLVSQAIYHSNGARYWASCDGCKYFIGEKVFYHCSTCPMAPGFDLCKTCWEQGQARVLGHASHVLV